MKQISERTNFRQNTSLCLIYGLTWYLVVGSGVYTQIYFYLRNLLSSRNFAKISLKTRDWDFSDQLVTLMKFIFSEANCEASLGVKG